MNTTWYALTDTVGQCVSIGTVIDADAIIERGLTTHTTEVPDGQVPHWTGTDLVAVDPPPPPPPPKTLEDQIADAVAKAFAKELKR